MNTRDCWIPGHHGFRADSAVVEANGRLWRALDAGVMSASADGDLLEASNGA